MAAIEEEVDRKVEAKSALKLSNRQTLLAVLQFLKKNQVRRDSSRRENEPQQPSFERIALTKIKSEIGSPSEGPTVSSAGPPMQIQSLRLPCKPEMFKGASSETRALRQIKSKKMELSYDNETESEEFLSIFDAFSNGIWENELELSDEELTALFTEHEKIPSPSRDSVRILNVAGDENWTPTELKDEKSLKVTVEESKVPSVAQEQSVTLMRKEATTPANILSFYTKLKKLSSSIPKKKLMKKSVEQEQSSSLKVAASACRQRRSAVKLKNGHSFCKKGISEKSQKCVRKQKKPFSSSEKNLKVKNDIILLKTPGKLSAGGRNATDRLVYTRQTSLLESPDCPGENSIVPSTAKTLSVDPKIVLNNGPVLISASEKSGLIQSLSPVQFSTSSSSDSLCTEQRKPILKQPTFKWTSSDTEVEKTCSNNSGADGFSLAKFTKEGLIRKPVFDGFKPPPSLSSGETSVLTPPPQNQASFLSHPPVSRKDFGKKTPLLRAPQFTPSEAHFKIYQSLGSLTQGLDSRTFNEQSSAQLITQKVLDSPDLKSSSSFCFPKQDQEGCNARKTLNFSLQSVARSPSKVQSQTKQVLHRANHLCLPPFAQSPVKTSEKRRVRKKECGESILKVEDANGSGVVRRLAIKRLAPGDLEEKHLLLLEGETFVRNSSEVAGAWSRTIRLNGVDRKMFNILKRAKVLLYKIDNETMETVQLPASQPFAEVMEPSAECQSNNTEPLLAETEVLQEESSSKVPAFQTFVKVMETSSTEGAGSISEPVVTGAEVPERDESDSKVPAFQTSVNVMETSSTEGVGSVSEPVVTGTEVPERDESDSKEVDSGIHLKNRMISSPVSENFKREQEAEKKSDSEGEAAVAQLVVAPRKLERVNKRSGSRCRRIPVKEDPRTESALQREDRGSVQLSALKSSLKVKKSMKTRVTKRKIKIKLDEDTPALEEKKLEFQLSELKSSLKVKKSMKTRVIKRKIKMKLDEDTPALEEKKLKFQEPSEDGLRNIPVCPRVSVEVLQSGNKIPEGVLRLSALPVGVEEIKPTVRLKAKRKKLCQQLKRDEGDMTLEKPCLSKGQCMKLSGSKQEGISHICKFCGSAFSSKHHLAQHTIFKHPDPPGEKMASRCRRHKRVKDLSQVLHNNETVTEKAENKPCFLIEGQLYNANESEKNTCILDHHIEEEKPHICRNCGMLFHDLSLLNEHKQTHRGKRVACTECGKFFASSHHVKRHQVVHTGEKPFECTECGKWFSRLAHVRRHKLIHTGERPFKCDQCDKGFSSLSHVKRHYVTHTGEKPFFCSDCGKSFTRLAHLHRHQLGHREPPSYKCTVCGKCFRADLQLERHLKRHKNCLKNCPECGRPFFNLLQYNQHILKHAKKKPFVCTECKICFRDEKYLQNHMIVHKEAKPRKCTNCEAVFSDQSVFLQHQQLHLGGEKYKCKECGRTFNKLLHLNEHQQCCGVVSSNIEETFPRETGSSKYSLRKTERKIYAEDDELQDEDYLSLAKEITVKVEPCDTSLPVEKTVSRDTNHVG